MLNFGNLNNKPFALVVLLMLPLAEMASVNVYQKTHPSSPEVGNAPHFYWNSFFNNHPGNFDKSAPDSASPIELLNWMVASHQQELRLKEQQQKRHLFLSDGWGPGGRTLAIAAKNGSDKSGNLQQQNQKPQPQQKQQRTGNEVVKTKQKNDDKFQQQQKNHHLALKWAIPGLFGQF